MKFYDLKDSQLIELVCDDVNNHSTQLDIDYNLLKEELTEHYIRIEDLRNKIDILSQQINDCTGAICQLRTLLTEKPKQKDDLEIFYTKDWDEVYLKIMNEQIIIDF